MLFVELEIPKSEIYRISLDGIDGGTYFWDQKIISISDFNLLHGDSGGLIKPTKGSMVLTPDVSIPECTARVYWNDDGDDTDLQLIYTGYCRRTNTATTSVSYKIYEKKYDVKLLDEGTDENGDEVAIPMAVGTVTHRTPQRTGTDTEYRYYKSGIDGTKGIDWHCYDDGVNIDGNVTETNTDGTGTFTLSVMSVGKVTISGTSAVATDLDTFSQWACNRLGENSNVKLSASPSPRLDFWADRQTPLTTTMDKVTGYGNHIIYNDEKGTYHLVDRETSNGSRVIDEFEIFDAPLSDPNPIKWLKATWELRKPAAQAVVLEADKHEKISLGPVDIGQEIDIEAYNEAESDVQAALDILVASWSKSRGEVVMPIGNNLVSPGEALFWLDEDHPEPKSVAIKARKLSYSFMKEEITVSGEGTST